MVELYPQDFCEVDILDLGAQVDMYITDVSTYENFLDLISMTELEPTMMVSKKVDSYPLVYRLIKLVLILLVATTSIE